MASEAETLVSLADSTNGAWQQEEADNSHNSRHTESGERVAALEGTAIIDCV